MKHSIVVYDVPLSEVVRKYSKLVFSYPTEKIWNPKGVSLKRRVESNPTFEKAVKKVLKRDSIEKYIVSEDDACPTRCIDGRIRLGWESDQDMQGRSLGPKVAGGTVHAALAHRIVDSEHLSDKLRFEEDIKYVVQRFKEIGFGSGGHIDDHQSVWNTGCGAVDNINLILDKLQHPEQQEELRGLAQLILGEAFDKRYIANEVIGRMLYLDALKPSYMPKEHNDPHGEFLYKKTVVKLLRAEASKTQEPVPSLTGPHNEVAAVLNFIPGTTFDTDRFSFDNGNQIQVFAWDVWHMFEEARRLYRYDMTKRYDEQLEAISNRMKYVTTRTLLGIATMMVLTDGSLRLIAATPKPR
ncbi:MAG TPA: hypothetical protein VH234_02880 [Candidatus Saccharimonadales bacterium]|jgi:hypothetical protein|nr:hypothetical protein [Candidatus Saccharimonadales bacterium]